MILVDTSVIVAWLDASHPDHEICVTALDNCGAIEPLAVSPITFAELAAGGRTRESIDEELAGFIRLEMNFDAAFRAGHAFRRSGRSQKGSKPVLPDFFIRAQAAVLDIPHLTNDRRGLPAFPDVNFLFPEKKS